MEKINTTSGEVTKLKLIHGKPLYMGYKAFSPSHCTVFEKWKKKLNKFHYYNQMNHHNIQKELSSIYGYTANS